MALCFYCIVADQNTCNIISRTQTLRLSGVKLFAFASGIVQTRSGQTLKFSINCKILGISLLQLNVAITRQKLDHPNATHSAPPNRSNLRLATQIEWNIDLSLSPTPTSHRISKTRQIHPRGRISVHSPSVFLLLFTNPPTHVPPCNSQPTHLSLELKIWPRKDVRRLVSLATQSVAACVCVYMCFLTKYICHATQPCVLCVSLVNKREKSNLRTTAAEEGVCFIRRDKERERE